MKYMVPASLMGVALFVFALSGCSSTSTETASSTTPAADHDDADHDHADHDHADHDHADHDHAGHDHGDSGDDGKSDMEKMNAELAKLSPEDAASAGKQHFCPVTGEMLGTMGAPIKVDVNGQVVWVCCDDCKETVLESPDEYLAKLNAE